MIPVLLGVSLIALLRHPSGARRSHPDHDHGPGDAGDHRGDACRATAWINRYGSNTATFHRQCPAGRSRQARSSRRPTCRTLIADGIGVSLYLLAYSAVLSVLIAVPLAMWAAVRRDSAARPRGAARRHDRLGHAAVLDRAAADGGVRPDAALVSDPRLRRRILRPSASHVPAGADHGAVPGADPHPVAALLHPRRAGGGLHRGRPRQGPVAAAHHAQACAAQCGDPRRSRCWR